MKRTKWVLDPTHSEIGFRIKHLMITNVSGSFKNFEGSVETLGDDFSKATIRATIDMTSINTNNEQRDAHLRNSDFFEVDKYPQLTFESTDFKKLDDENFELTGDLTLKGVTREVTLNVEFSGVTRDPWGGERAGFIVTGKIRRSDFGVNFNGVMDTGGLMLGEEVKIHSEVQVVKQTEAVLA